jgi:hypothetical protein
MPELLVDFITSLDGYAAAEGWPGWWGLQGPEYLRWLGEHVERTPFWAASAFHQVTRPRLRLITPRR